MKDVELTIDEEIEEYLIEESWVKKLRKRYYIFEFPNGVIVKVSNHTDILEDKQTLWRVEIADEDNATYEKLEELEVCYLLNNFKWEALEDLDRETFYYFEDGDNIYI